MCGEYAENHAAELYTKDSEARRKYTIYKSNHRAGSRACEFERKEKERAEYTRNYTHSYYQCAQAAAPS
jgi:hypothetical protein